MSLTRLRVNDELCQSQASVYADREFGIVNAVGDGRERLVQVLLVGEFESSFHDSAENLASNGTHVGLGRCELWDDILKDERLHVVLDVGVAHDERAKRSGHVEGTVPLGGGGLTIHFAFLVRTFINDEYHVRLKDLINEAQDWQEGSLCPVACQREEERGRSGDRTVKCLVLVYKYDKS